MDSAGGTNDAEAKFVEGSVEVAGAKRAADAQDAEDYLTVWAQHAGAVAAPTASLHFDEEVLAALRARGVEFT